MAVLLPPASLIRSGGQHTATSLLPQPYTPVPEGSGFPLPRLWEDDVSSLKHLALLGISHAVNSDIGID